MLINRAKLDGTRFQLRSSLRDSLGTVVTDVPLQEDDSVQVFSINDFRPERYVGIGGAVRKPGRFPYRIGMTMRDLVLLAGGLQEGAYLSEAEIARLPSDRTTATTAVTIRVALDSSYLFERKPGQRYIGAPGLPVAAGGSPEVPLSPYDNVLIFNQPSWALDRLVTISGEVSFPGRYALKSRTERLTDIIQRAGGLTTDAYPAGTMFIRTQGAVGRVAIDVPEALKDPRSPENLQLLDGDSITVPQRSYTVSVSGAVNAPNVVAYVQGQGLSYYISDAGGPSRLADRGHAYVTQPTGKRETIGRFSEPRPMAGSYVVVPEIDPTDRTNWAQTLAGIAPVVTSLVTLLVALKKF